MSSNSRVLKTKGNQITSNFGLRTITYTSGELAGKTVTKNHNGIDLVGTNSSLDYIIAHTAGTVTAAGYDSSCGYYVNIETSPNVVMVYYHMKKGTVTVKTGDKVARGEVLGYMGATGNVTGAHLHFGIKQNGKWIDPKPYINADFTVAEPVPSAATPKDLPVLKSGCKGAGVETLQQLLNAKGFSCGTVDGSFGPATKKALTAYQKKKWPKDKSKWDGICGPETHASFWH